jgi:hypothetical protein
MPRNFRELEAQMAPERLARAEIKAKEINLHTTTLQ